MRYICPAVVDYGSIASHTFTRCPEGWGEEGDPPKDPSFANTHFDKFGECSSLS